MSSRRIRHASRTNRQFYAAYQRHINNLVDLKKVCKVIDLENCLQEERIEKMEVHVRNLVASFLAIRPVRFIPMAKGIQTPILCEPRARITKNKESKIVKVEAKTSTVKSDRRMRRLLNGVLFEREVLFATKSDKVKAAETAYATKNYITPKEIVILSEKAQKASQSYVKTIKVAGGKDIIQSRNRIKKERDRTLDMNVKGTKKIASHKKGKHSSRRQGQFASDKNHNIQLRKRGKLERKENKNILSTSKRVEVLWGEWNKNGMKNRTKIKLVNLIHDIRHGEVC